MRAILVPKINESYSNFKELHEIANEIYKWFLQKEIPIVNVYDEEFQYYDVLDIINSKKYPELSNFLNNRIALIYGDFSDNEMDKIGSFISPATYIDILKPEELKEYEKFKSGIIVFPNKPMLLHELQHAYDYWRSGGKNERGKGYSGEEVVNKIKHGYQPELSSYYTDPKEINAYFSQAISDHYWAGQSQYHFYGGEIDSSDIKYDFYEWKEQFKWFKFSFDPWKYLSEKDKKKFTNKFFSFYEKIKNIWEEEGKDGLLKRNLKIRGA